MQLPDLSQGDTTAKLLLHNAARFGADLRTIEGDALLAISTSGNSANVIAALAEARARRLRTIAMVGYDGGRVAAERLADHVVVTRSEHIPRIQEALDKRANAIRESIATEAVDYTMTPLSDPALNRQQSGEIRKLTAERMRQLPPNDFQDLLRSGMKEDEWLLLLHGAVLGFAAGLLRLAIFGPG